MKQAKSTTGTGKYELLLERCRALEPVPTAVAHPCEASALSAAIEAGQKKLIMLYALQGREWKFCRAGTV